jgi:hypothetical protein
MRVGIGPSLAERPTQLEDTGHLLEFAQLRPPYLQCQVGQALATGTFANDCTVPPSATPTPGIASSSAER